VDLGDWSIRNWRALAGLTSAVLVVSGGLAGAITDYRGYFPALGGPNGLLYDLTLKVAQPWRRNIPTVPAVFVAIDDASLSTPDLAALPRALFQPVWARLIDGLLEARARRIAFDVVFAYAGADFQVGSFVLPDYDRSLIESLDRARDRIVLGRFPSVPPAPPFQRAAGGSRVGVLDLQLESDGRVRSTAPLLRLADGRIALGFAALAAGLNVRQASAAQRILIAPYAPMTDTPTYSLATLLDCLSSAEGLEQVRRYIEGRIVVVGTAVLGEDEHRGPTRFLGGGRPAPPTDRCAPHIGLFKRADIDNAPGALMQIAAIQSAASERPVSLAPKWLRLIAGAGLTLLFALMAFRDESALALGERDVSPASILFVQLARSVAFGLVGPVLFGCLISVVAFIFADIWLPMGYPILVTISAFAAIVGIRSVRHRALFRSLYRTAGRYLPPERLVTLARSGFADPLDGHERDVSILLVDLAGFTSFSNRPDLSASDIVRMANRYFTLMQGIIDRHGGCSDKFLGDAVLAFWNGLSDEPDHALKALTAASEIISAIGHAKESEDNLLAARAIVCSGKVYVGDLGAKQRSNFTIIGPAVNETFRLEKVPDIYGLSLLVAGSASEMIQASNSSMQSIGLLENNVLVRIDDVELKGFDGVRPIYTLVPKDDPGLADFQAARNALDRKMYGEALARLKAVGSGMLQLAAKSLLRQVDPVPMRAHEGGRGESTPRM
jgi:adenylate cyclase